MSKTENTMRMILAAVLAMTASAAVAEEIDEAFKLAVSGRDTYWTCIAQEYGRDANQGLSEPDFTQRVASACPSERQSFRVALVEYLTMKSPDADAGEHMTTANKAIALAEQDIVTAFVRRKARAK
jgi:hypothetical protein